MSKGVSQASLGWPQDTSLYSTMPLSTGVSALLHQVWTVSIDNMLHIKQPQIYAHILRGREEKALWIRVQPPSP